MAETTGPQGPASADLMREISDLEGRLGELRQAAAMPRTDLRATLDAALVELELAVGALHALGSGPAAGEGRSAAEDERRVLRTVFQDAPVPLFLLDRDAGVRRVNRQAATLLGTSPGYVSGKPFTVFCDLPTRAALRSQLAAVVRTGRRRQAAVRFLSRKSPVEAVVTLARVWIRGEPEPMVIAAATLDPRRMPAASAPEQADGADEAVATVVHRMDVLATAGELLLDEPVFNESVAVRRLGRLLSSELADWAFIDVAQSPEPGTAAAGAQLRRVVAAGPEEQEDQELTRRLEDLDPAPDTLPYSVFTTRQGSLHPHVAELGLLGETAGGEPVCAMITATTVLSAPIEDGERCLGTITLAGRGEHGPFDLMDLGVVQRIGRYLALVIRAARLYRRKTEVAASLQASLLPRALPSIPGLDVAARYLTATRGVEVGGDFYDVFESAAGWGFVLGDVCGKGEEAAAVTATARHGVRLLARWKNEPAEVLSMVNEALLSEERFVTAVLAEVAVPGSSMRITLATAGHPPAIVIRPNGRVRAAAGGGVPLGLFDDFEPGLDSVELAAGDTLLMHSDGVLDACDVRRRRFGQERLMDVLAATADRPVQEMLLAVERALMDFCDGDLRDDVSVLALRVLPEAVA